MKWATIGSTLAGETKRRVILQSICVFAHRQSVAGGVTISLRESQQRLHDSAESARLCVF